MPAASRSSKACTECRQVKLRCDSKVNFPDPCTRCKSRSLTCTFDPAFKRIPTKGQVERLTREVEKLRASQGQLQVPQAPYSYTSSAGSPPSQSSPDESLSLLSLPPIEPDSYFGLSDPIEKVAIFRLGGFQLPAIRVRECFLHFARHQYKHLPVVDFRRHYAEIYSVTPFLFWTILVVAIRSSSATAELLSSIEGPYNDYLGRVLIRSPLSLSSIQALLLLCLWPFPVQTQRQDPGWNLCNIALSATVQQGLPAKIFRKKGWANDEEQVICRTWLACFYVGARLSCNLAIAPPLRTPEDMANVTKALSIAGTTGEFTAQLEIQRQLASCLSVLSSDQALIESSSAIQLYDRELSAISTQYKDHWTKECDLSLLIAKLQLYTLVILSAKTDNFKSSTNVAGFQNSVGLCLLKGFHTAVRMISVYSNYLDETKNDTHIDTDIQPTHWILPKPFHLSFAQATFFLLRFTTSGSHFPETDRDIARNHIRLARDLLLRNSQRPDDEAERAARLIQTLSSSDGADVTIQLEEDLHIVRTASRRAAVIRGQSSSHDQPIPEVFDDAVPPEFDPAAISSNPAENGAIEWQWPEPWQLYTGVPNDVWDVSNYPGMMPPVGDWTGAATIMDYASYQV
jgi:hypothetical protein